MRIAYLSTFYPFRGGIAQFNALMYRQLERLGNQVNAFTFTTQYPEILFPGKTQFATPEDNADAIASNRVLNSINPISYLQASHKIGKQNPDMLLMKYWLPYFAPSLGTVSRNLRKKGTKSIVMLDNVVPHEKRFFDEAFTKYFLNNTDGYVVMSKAVENALLERKPDAKYFFHPHPIYEHFGEKIEKTEAINQLKSEVHQGKKVLLYFGFIRKYKGVDLLLEAFKDLDEDYSLIIAGESYLSEEETKELQTQINNHPKKDSIDVRMRYIPDWEVNLLFSAADATVLPYRNATQSGVTAIAFHFEVPVVITDVGGLRELIEPYRAGTVASSPHADKIREAIEELFEKKKETSFESNLQSFKQKYSWQALANRITDFHSQL